MNGKNVGAGWCLHALSTSVCLSIEPSLPESALAHAMHLVGACQGTNLPSINAAEADHDFRLLTCHQCAFSHIIYSWGEATYAAAETHLEGNVGRHQIPLNHLAPSPINLWHVIVDAFSFGSTILQLEPPLS